MMGTLYLESLWLIAPHRFKRNAYNIAKCLFQQIEGRTDIDERLVSTKGVSRLFNWNNYIPSGYPRPIQTFAPNKKNLIFFFLVCGCSYQTGRYGTDGFSGERVYCKS